MANGGWNTVIEDEIIFSAAAIDLDSSEKFALFCAIRSIKMTNGIGLFSDVGKEGKPSQLKRAPLRRPEGISKMTWYRAVRGIEEHGFIRPAAQRGRTANLIEWCEDWRRFNPQPKTKCPRNKDSDGRWRKAEKRPQIKDIECPRSKDIECPRSKDISGAKCPRNEDTLSILQVTVSTPPNSGVGVGVSSVLESIGAAVEANEHDPAHQRRMAVFEHSLQESMTAPRVEQAKRQAEQEERQSPEAIAALVGVTEAEAQQWIDQLGAACCLSLAEGVANDKSVTSPPGAFRHRARNAANKYKRKVGTAC